MKLKNLATNILGKNCIYYKEIDSTQSEIWRLIEKNQIEDGTLIMADVQTSGKGTHGRKWYTEENGNIAFSFYIETNCKIEEAKGITTKIAKILVSIFKDFYNINVEIKEPNDLVHNGKKIGGILTEGKTYKETLKFLVIGIGINTSQTIFNKEVKNIATSIKNEFGVDVDREAVISEFCNRFENFALGTGLNAKKRKDMKMKVGFLFPGQGAQSVGMGKDIYEKYDKARKVYDEVKNLTGIDIAKISFEGPEEELFQTKNTQMAILTMSLAILEILKEKGIVADMSAGLSLGEYSALIYSGALGFEEGVKLVQKRGEYMQNLVPKGEWKMAAIMGMSEKQVRDICSKVKKGFAVPANFNCAGQIVISGEKEGIEEAEKIAKEMGAKKVRILNTAGPFHTEKLTKSSEALRNELENVTINKFNTKVVKNIDGDFYNETDDVKDILAKHIINPVRFDKTIETMLNNGVDTFIEIGPGKTLSGFVKRTPTDKQINILSINNVDSLEQLESNM